MRAGGALFATVGLLLAAGGARLAYIEQRQGPALREEAQRQQTTQVTISALRGEIWDTRGRVLAGTVRRPSVFADPMALQGPLGLPESDRLRELRLATHSLAPVLGISAADLEKLLSGPTQPRFVWLKRDVGDEQLGAVRQVVEARQLRGVGVQMEPHRVYPQGRVAPHLLGFVGTDRVEGERRGAYEDLRGLAGIEEAYNQALRGRPGHRSATVDAGRRRVRAEDYEPAVDGRTLVLTIDAYIQEIAQQKLRDAVNQYAAEWAATVVIDPQTGEVLAMAAVPDFDPADPLPPGFEQMNESQREVAKLRWRNRAVSDSYEPGSVFKPFVASCALDEGVVRIDEVFAINGPVHSFGRRVIHDTHPYGSLAVHEIISKSSNIGMGMIGARCGMDRLHRYVRRFGFGDLTGLGLPGEHTGMVQDFSRWNASFSPQSIPIGQEIGVTPIQVVTAFSVFCNGGVLLRPRIVRGVIGPDGETVADYSRPVPIRRVLEERTAEMFRRQALVEAVTTGTAKLARLDEYQVFGKTGTAQIAGARNRGYGSAGYVASFVGGAPSDRPRVVCLVSVYHPTKGGYYGGVISAPVVKQILAETLAYMQVPPELAVDTGKDRAGKKPAKKEEDVGGF